MRNVVVTGLGMVTPLGREPRKVLELIEEGVSAAVEPKFETGAFGCPLYAPVLDFDAQEYFCDNKLLRFMNRDAQLAAVAADMAIKDAGVIVGEAYPEEDIALYGSTGVAGLTAEEIQRIIRYAADELGGLSFSNFGRVALKRVRPVLSFKILANMPICFVSIFQNIKGPNAVYTPWEGNGAQAIAAGVRAIRSGKASCALVGGCDVKTRELSFINLKQSGALESWKRHGRGCVPGEGACFLWLEEEESAIERGKEPYARIRDYKFGSVGCDHEEREVYISILSKLSKKNEPKTLFAAGDGDIGITEKEEHAVKAAGMDIHDCVRPKSGLGNLFAAAAAVQLSLATAFIKGQDSMQQVAANCFGYGSEQGSFVLESPCNG